MTNPSLFHNCAHCLYSWEVKTENDKALTCGLQDKIIRGKLKRKRVAPDHICEEFEEEVRY